MNYLLESKFYLKYVYFLAEEEDSPVIRGFSDDEPLVIA